MDFHSAIGSFGGKRIALIGDLVADQFLNGTISRVSREAPVFILRHEETVTLPGAAANAAANVASMGGEPILLGVIGTDSEGERLKASLGNKGVAAGHILSDPEIKTTTKVRVLAGQHYAVRQQVIRIDYENSGELSAELRKRLQDKLDEVAAEIDAIIVSDYGYGAVFDAIFAQARDIADRRGIPLVVDSRYRLSSLTGATAATPNSEEVEQIAGEAFSDNDCQRLRESLGCTALLVTNGNKGMTLFENGTSAHFDAVGSPEPVDVTGAGDTVIAAFTLALAAGVGYSDAATIANHAGGIVVMKKRTATVSVDELLASLGGAYAAANAEV
ncbi:MAG: bifunctional heptose 7-phosphate kinase/heptose 1-phosphate adenyltransferase [Pyrinomonadaceae bacterium]